MRWNLLAFGGMTLGVVIAAIILSIKLLTPEVINNNEEVLLGALIGIISSSFGGAIAYSMGVMQALTGPSEPEPTITEKMHLESIRMITELGGGDVVSTDKENS